MAAGSPLTKAEAAEILLVRAIEESRQHPIDSAQLIDALHSAGDVDDEARWLARRARYLLANPLQGFRPVLALADLPRTGFAPLVIVPVLLGLASNYLGPAEGVHVLVNPIVILIAWNLAIYSAVVVRPFWRGRSAPLQGLPLKRFSPTAIRRGRTVADRRRSQVRLAWPWAWLLSALVPRLWVRLHEGVREASEGPAGFAAVSRTFARYCVAAVGPVILVTVRRALSCAAMAIAIGAVLGMYLRGLFFAYHAVWRSTFITDPETVSLILRSLFGVQAILLGREVPDERQVLLLMGPSGVPAETWIHLYAVSVLALVILPRSVMTLYGSLRLRNLGQAVKLDFSDEYYRQLVDEARTLQVGKIQADIREITRMESARLVAAVVTFICDRLYDAKVASRIRGFREEGGKIVDLEKAIGGDCEAFQKELTRFLSEAQADFEGGLGRNIERKIGARLRLDALSREAARGVAPASGASVRGLGQSLGRSLADVVAVAVSAALVAVIGTVSGGFGEVFGLALLLPLVESGPVGWVIGAVGGLVLAGAGWFVGREKLTESMKQISLPGPMVKVVLWHGRVEKIVSDGREKCRMHITEELRKELDQLCLKIAEHIWTELKPALGERQQLARQLDS